MRFTTLPVFAHLDVIILLKLLAKKLLVKWPNKTLFRKTRILKAYKTKYSERGGVNSPCAPWLIVLPCLPGNAGCLRHIPLQKRQRIFFILLNNFSTLIFFGDEWIASRTYSLSFWSANALSESRHLSFLCEGRKQVVQALFYETAWQVVTMVLVPSCWRPEQIQIEIPIKSNRNSYGSLYIRNRNSPY